MEKPRSDDSTQMLSRLKAPKLETISQVKSYPKRLRIRRRGHYLRIQRLGKRVYTQHLIAYLAKSAQHQTRFGVTVSKKMGKAHRRNFIKRLLREAFRHSDLRHSKGFDVSVISRQECPPLHLSEMIQEMNELAKLGAEMNQTRDQVKKKRTQLKKSNAAPVSRGEGKKGLLDSVMTSASKDHPSLSSEMRSAQSRIDDE